MTLAVIVCGGPIRQEREPDYSGGAARLAIPTRSGTTMKRAVVGAPWPTFPPQLASKRTIGPHSWQQRETGPSGQPGVGLALPPKATPEDLLPRSWDASAPTVPSGPVVQTKRAAIPVSMAFDR